MKFPEHWPIARERRWVRVAWVVIGILAIPATGLFIVLGLMGDFPLNNSAMFAGSLLAWFYYGVHGIRPARARSSRPPEDSAPDSR